MNSEGNNVLVLFENILNEIPEYKNYDKFSKTDATTSSESVCEELNDSEGKCKEVKEICKTIVNKLNKFNKKNYTESEHNDTCSFFTWWTYDEIIKKFKNNCKTSFDKCNITKFNDIVNREYNKVVGKNCIFYLMKPKYCEYLKYIESIYEKYMRECCAYFFSKNYFDNCQKYFKCGDKYTPYHLLSKLKCGHAVSEKYWENLINELAVDRSIKSKDENIYKGIFSILMKDTFYKGITFGFVVVGILFCIFLFYKITHGRRNKYKDNFLDPDGNLARFYQAKHRKTNWDDSKIRLSYYVV
ncbi:PIR Superfamily Protein [Plasmodium malariae]|uniref:PIR Superfamily Protein n=1 Tax=Plasmodium malariae TaxID=5858 RepID=A0A1A8X670_PLAMA|nr:PIR Superfamily Protein [Plasmodium malariae]